MEGQGSHVKGKYRVIFDNPDLVKLAVLGGGRMLGRRKHFCHFFAISPHTPVLWWVLSPMGGIQGAYFAVGGVMVVGYGINGGFLSQYW